MAPGWMGQPVVEPNHGEADQARFLAERGRDLFAKLAKRQLKRGVLPSVVALQEAINGFVAARDRNPRPFVWKAIIAAAKICRASATGDFTPDSRPLLAPGPGSGPPSAPRFTTGR
jgi:hypothetical protein